ncbi:hypothetical protein DWW36_00290 [Erysipelotrichaceae bacterium AF15-26LB]|nr:hypothetical protein DWX45_11905 [Erysipelotrichaceae bacterium AF19-24AC]RJV92892.1 hypothetical protein DWW36_00290 [Erysipelotrichaceae bacterium AF15-26LB]
MKPCEARCLSISFISQMVMIFSYFYLQLLNTVSYFILPDTMHALKQTAIVQLACILLMPLYDKKQIMSTSMIFTISVFNHYPCAYDTVRDNTIWYTALLLLFALFQSWKNTE